MNSHVLKWNVIHSSRNTHKGPNGNWTVNSSNNFLFKIQWNLHHLINCKLYYKWCRLNLIKYEKRKKHECVISIRSSTKLVEAICAYKCVSKKRVFHFQCFKHPIHSWFFISDERYFIPSVVFLFFFWRRKNNYLILYFSLANIWWWWWSWWGFISWVKRRKLSLFLFCISFQQKSLVWLTFWRRDNFPFDVFFYIWEKKNHKDV